MANTNGIFQRGSSHYLRVVLPINHELQKQYKSGKIILSLGSCSYREAVTLGTIKRAEILGLIAPAQKTTAEQAPTKRTPTAYYLRDIYQRWKESKPRSSDAINSCMRALILFEEQTKNPILQELTRAQGDSFRAWLQQPERNTTSKTARDRLTWVKSLLKYAYRDLEIINRHPWEGIEIHSQTTQKRRPWDVSELNKLFSNELFTSYQLPKDWRCGGDAAYWLPILAIFTGARLSELAQLKPSDIALDCEIPTISISNAGAGQQVKTEAAIRKIPIHSEVIRLGFLNYVQKTVMANDTQLWSKLKFRKNKPGGNYSNWFGEFRKELELPQGLDFHSFRHGVRSQLAENDVPEPTIDAIMGHEIKGSTGAKIYSHRTTSSIKAAIELIKYRDLRLPNELCKLNL
ncbi:site-specific integrase [Polynucleobacter sp. UB-Siik-W21]|uniref:site-specific integrase n=1 Tax=Polynucleobacter sp. UB-Siik-W21 TaxID=1855646 RepID=UPI001BFE6F1A|nr:site-specific integrase [Polynucleobacter sp. UB-Siik-W21]QWD69655.1 tyrosine-type recombinase/integrase [Polynucleobacter sp. UB-Siik-W21]